MSICVEIYSCQCEYSLAEKPIGQIGLYGMILFPLCDERHRLRLLLVVPESDGKTCRPINLLAHLWRPSLRCGFKFLRSRKVGIIFNKT